MSYIVRTYPDASFAFDISSQRSFFAEGTASQLLATFIDNVDASIPEQFLNIVPGGHHAVALEDAELLRREVRGFVEGKSILRRNLSGVNRYGSEETPFQKLTTYAIKEWRVINATIEVSYRCNLNCFFCYLENHSSPGLSREELAVLADQLYSAGTIFVVFTGGEPLLRGDIYEVMKDYSCRGFALELKTNGILMDEKAVEKISLLNIYNLQVSIYEIESGQVSLIGARYDFDRLARNISSAVKAELPVSLSVLVGKHNIDRLESYHDTLTKLGVEDIAYSPYITPNRNNGSVFASTIRLSQAEMEEKLYPFLVGIDGTAKPTKYRERIPSGPICYAGRDQITVTPSGDVYPCLDFPLSLGTLKESTFSKILGQRKKFLSQYILEKMPQCMECDIVEYCDSCPGTALLELGDYVTPASHKCDVSRFSFCSLTRGKEV